MNERRLCDSSQLVDGGRGVRFDLPDPDRLGAGGTAPAFVVRHAGRVFAYLNRCGHVSVELDWRVLR
jgi:nitrite reductase/ring-hydroxylating ferredoxin subunit